MTRWSQGRDWLDWISFAAGFLFGLGKAIAFWVHDAFVTWLDLLDAKHAAFKWVAMFLIVAVISAHIVLSVMP